MQQHDSVDPLGLLYKRIGKKSLQIFFIAFAIFAVGALLNLRKVDAQSTPHTIRVIEVRYFPSGQPIPYQPDTLSAELQDHLSEASSFHKYSDPSATPTVDVEVVQVYNRNTYRPNPTGTWEGSFDAILDHDNLCNVITSQDIDQVWLWVNSTVDTAPGLEFALSGDIYTELGFPSFCGTKSFIYMGYDYSRSSDLALHSFGHMMEATINLFQGEDVFWYGYSGIVNPPGNNVRCGNVHFPPNGTADYDYANTTYVDSYCKNWTMQGQNPTTNFNCTEWGCNQLGYLKWWFQNMPNESTGHYWGYQLLPSWWEFTYDLDFNFNKYAIDRRFFFNRANLNVDCSTTKNLPAPTNTLNFNHAGCGLDDDFILLSTSYRAASGSGNAQRISTATYGGSAMTKLCAANDNEYVTELWYYNGANSAGANINITWDSSYGGTAQDIIVNAKSLQNVENSSPITASACNSSNGAWVGNPSIGMNPSVSFNSAANDFVFGVATTYTGNGNEIINGTGINLWVLNTSNVYSNALKTTGEASGMTLGWANSVSWPWSTAGVSINLTESGIPSIDAEFTIDTPSTYDLPYTVDFFDQSIVNNTTIHYRLWDFDGDDLIDSEEVNPTFDYTISGSYRLMLIAHDGYIFDIEYKPNFIEILGNDLALSFVQPNTDKIVSKENPSTTIAWIANNPYEVSNVNLYYDTNNTGFDGTLVATKPDGNGATSYHSWNTTNLAAGEYYVYLVMNFNGIDFKIYNTHKITVTQNYSPNITLIEPNSINDRANTTYTIKWQGGDVDTPSASVDLYYEVVGVPGVRQLIAADVPYNNNPVGGFTFTYNWNTTALANGLYRVVGIIDDGINATKESYAPGFLTIDHAGNYGNYTYPAIVNPGAPSTWILAYDHGQNISPQERFNFGDGSEKYVAGDWDGDGFDDFAIYDNGLWVLLMDDGTYSTSTYVNFDYSGTTSEQPIAGDWDGDGVDGIGVYYNGRFILANNPFTPNPDYNIYWGNITNGKAVAGDWNGDGIDSTGLYIVGNFKLTNTHSSTPVVAYNFNYGPTTDPNEIPVVGDWNGDTIETVGLYHHSGTWTLTNSTNGGSNDYNYNYGSTNALPVAGKWNDGSSVTMTGLTSMSASTFEFDWSDRSIDQDADISFYLDSDQIASNGTQIVNGISEDSDTDTYTWTTRNAKTGTYYVYAELEEQSGLTLTSYSSNTINVVNTAPNITTTTLTNAYTDVNYSFTVAAADTQNDTLTWELVSGPLGLSINPTSGELSWDTSSVAVGSYNLEVKASDQEFNDVQALTLVVEDRDDYNRAIVITNSSGSTISDLEQKIEIDTQAAITAGKLNADCSNLAFYTSANNELQYFLESGCNTTSTKIWVKIPSLAVGANTVHVRYGDRISPALELTMNSNSYVAAFKVACPSGWQAVNLLNSNKFLYGSTVYGNGGGSDTHVHTYSGQTGWINQVKELANAPSYTHSIDHKHTMNGTTATSSNLPPYLDVNFCEHISSALPQSVGGTDYVGMFESVPTNWTADSSMTGKFLRGASTTGGTGGAATHTHTYSGQTNTVDNRSSSNDTYAGGSLITVKFGHNHSYSGTTTASSSLPPYLQYIFATPTATTTKIEGGSLSIFKQLPPLGWSRVSALDGKFVYGGSTYGATGGSDSHNHTMSGATGNSGNGSDTRTSGGNHDSYNNHSHNYNLTTTSTNSLPPYVTVIFGKEKTGSLSYTVGSETVIE